MLHFFAFKHYNVYMNNPLFWLVWIALVALSFGVPFWASQRFKKKAYEVNEFNSTQEIRGIDLITEMFIYYGIDEFDTNIIGGLFTDNYNFINKTLNLTSSTYYGSSLSCHAIACHEAGHAIQFKKNYFWAAFSKKYVHLVQIISFVTIGILFFYIFFPSLLLLYIFCVGSGILFLYQGVVVMIEYDATHRALKFFKNSKYFDEFALKNARKVLMSAWTTYWASWFSSFLQFAFSLVLVIFATFGIALFLR